MATPVSTVPLPIETLRPSPLNTRRRLDPQAMKELTDSVRAHGILQPLLVRPLDGGKIFEVVFGHRRLAAAKAAKLPDVPCSVRPMSDQEAIEVGLVENGQRNDLHPLDEADGYRKLMKEAGYDAAAIAAKIGKSASHVYQRLKLAELIPEAAEAFGADQITAGHAVQIARLQPKYQKEALAECFEEQYHGRARGREKTLVGVRALAAWIAENVHLDLAAAPWKKDDATLVPAAGPCTTCPKRTGFVPDLFPDIAKKDTCTDRGCFGQKQDAFLARAQAALKAQKASYLEISRDYTDRGDGGPINPGAWEEAKPKSCPHVTTGLVVGGQGRGQVLTVCAEPRCKVHRPWAGSSERDRTARKKIEAKHRVELAFRAKLLDQVLARVPSPLGSPELRLVAAGYFQEIWHENRVRVMRRHGWIPEKGRPAGSRDHQRVAEQKIEKLTGTPLAGLLLELALIRALDIGSYSDEGKKALLETAKRYKVNPEAIRRELAQPKKAAGGKKTK